MPRGSAARGFLSNEAFIDGLDVKLDLGDPKAVFRHVFACLKRRVIVYPSENYYYFQFPANGKTVWGSLTLNVRSRDRGVLGFGYSAKNDKYRDPFFRGDGGGMALSTKHGLFVKKVDESLYSVTFEKKTVLFDLYRPAMPRPPASMLRDDERYVGPCFDESGLRFFLVFNTIEKCFYWVLNEESPIPETLTRFAPDILIGLRTEYAFFDDRAKRRKILIGVEGLNVLQNNWYDGPFDQLPDNYVLTGEVSLKKYIEICYPHLRGKIDKYGNLRGEKGSRVAIAPYLVYFYKGDLLELVARSRLHGDGSSFYGSLTRQVFEIPMQFLDGLGDPPR